uniref:Uncharacterized protein n=1 Tax=Ditylenchus dipsaci TaxID=166011 RepID=A0A915DVV2_9BILA
MYPYSHSRYPYLLSRYSYLLSRYPHPFSRYPYLLSSTPTNSPGSPTLFLGTLTHSPVTPPPPYSLSWHTHPHLVFLACLLNWQGYLIFLFTHSLCYLLAFLKTLQTKFE